MKIQKILMDNGWKHATEAEPIVLIQKHGEMAIIDWYQQTTLDGEVHEYNSRYCIEIIYSLEALPQKEFSTFGTNGDLACKVCNGISYNSLKCNHCGAMRSNAEQRDKTNAGLKR